MQLEELGFGEWLRSRLRDPDADEPRIARVITVDKERCTIAGPLGTVPAEVTGRLLYCTDSMEELPCVGDWVLADYLDQQTHAIIHEVVPRKTILRRRTAGGGSAYQPIAANIDVACIVQSCDVDYSLNRLDRYIVMASDGGITPRLLLTKCDLVPGAEVDRLVEQVRKDRRIDVATLSSTSGAGYEQLARSLERGRTYCLLGSSGVGKSTILNRLMGGETLAVGAVQEKSGKGRHTTTRRQLMALDNGALFVDTPGMRELGMLGFGAGLEEGYQEIVAAAARCRYSDCTHTVEKGCAVRDAVAAGEVSAQRYESYLKLQRESDHYEMTYLERRKKDRAFGKMLKNYEKSKREG